MLRVGFDSSEPTDNPIGARQQRGPRRSKTCSVRGSTPRAVWPSCWISHRTVNSGVAYTGVSVYSLRMTKPLSEGQKGEAVVLALRLPPLLVEAIDKVQREQEGKLTVRARLSRSEVARALLEEALRAHNALPPIDGPTEPVAPVPEPPAEPVRADPSPRADTERRRTVTKKPKAPTGSKSTKVKRKAKRTPRP